MTKSERLTYIKEAAARMAEEKEYITRMCQEDAVAPIDADTDLTSIENIQGLVIEGAQKIAGGFRRLPIIIL